MIWSDADSEDEIESESSQESGMNFSQNMEMMASMFGVSSSAANNFTELIPGSKGETISKVIEENYELVDGSWPDNAYEVVLIVDRNQRISAVTLYQLGLISKETYQKMETQVEEGEEVDPVTLSYDDVKDHTFYLVPACDFYQEVESGTEVPMFRAIEAGTVEEQQLKDNAIELTISGMIRPVEDANNASIMDAVGYTSLLTDVLISHTNESAVVLAQEANPEDNVLNGMKFEEADEETKMAASIGYLQAMGMMELAANSESEFLLSFYDQYIGGATLEDNLEQFGKIYYEVPSSISIYADTFEAKDGIADAITSYNESKSEEEQITYTDYVALLTSSVTSIINGISYVLIAFVAISLVVSCIMIGIITHISVMERTKEIGILRALGASKGNISQVFNAETFIIGCCAGLLGMGISYLLLIPINAVIYRVSQIKGLSAQIPISAVVILILLSIVITLIGGFIPAKKAAKKDPVIALRTE
jgi:putative ABC transport system permease protein